MYLFKKQNYFKGFSFKRPPLLRSMQPWYVGSRNGGEILNKIALYNLKNHVLISTSTKEKVKKPL